jgi:hypothetical protein
MVGYLVNVIATNKLADVLTVYFKAEAFRKDYVGEVPVITLTAVALLCLDRRQQ